MNELEHFKNIFENDKNSFCFNAFSFHPLIINDEILLKFKEVYIKEFDLKIKFKIYEDKIKNKLNKDVNLFLIEMFFFFDKHLLFYSLFGNKKELKKHTVLKSLKNYLYACNPEKLIDRKNFSPIVIGKTDYNSLFGINEFTINSLLGNNIKKDNHDKLYFLEKSSVGFYGISKKSRIWIQTPLSLNQLVKFLYDKCINYQLPLNNLDSFFKEDNYIENFLNIEFHNFILDPLLFSKDFFIDKNDTLFSFQQKNNNKVNVFYLKNNIFNFSIKKNNIDYEIIDENWDFDLAEYFLSCSFLYHKKLGFIKKFQKPISNFNFEVKFCYYNLTSVDNLSEKGDFIEAKKRIPQKANNMIRYIDKKDVFYDFQISEKDNKKNHKPFDLNTITFELSEYKSVFGDVLLFFLKKFIDCDINFSMFVLDNMHRWQNGEIGDFLFFINIDLDNQKHKEYVEQIIGLDNIPPKETKFYYCHIIHCKGLIKNQNGKFTQSRSKSISNLKEVIGQTIKTFLYFHPKTENKKFTECLKLFKTTYNLNCDIELLLGNQIYYQQIICYPKFKVSDPEVELILGHTQAAINNGGLFFAFLTDDS